MFCNNCGAQNPDGANNCSNCGARLNNAQQTSQPAAPVQPVTPAQPQKPKNNKGLIIGIVAGVVALIAIVAVVLVFVLGGDKDKDDEKDDSGTTKAAVTQDAGDKNKDDKENNKSNNKPATSSMSYQDVVKEYSKLILSGDFSGALKYSAIDVEGYLTDVANSNGSSMSAICDALEGIIYYELDEEVEITSIDQFYTVMGKMFREDMGSYTVSEVKITEFDLLDITDSYDMDDIKEEYIDCYAFWGFGFDENDLPKYVDTSKITEAYDIEAEVTVTLSDGTSDTFDFWGYVVNYNGNWLVVGEPMHDML
ncbi:MAG: zinc-ribbon domain-containing protein [Candidatus Fimenecus sp.]